MKISILISAGVVLLYLMTACLLGLKLLRQRPVTQPYKLLAGALAVVALLGHGLILRQQILLPVGFNLGFYHAFSLMAWVVVLFIALVGLFRPMRHLLALCLPVAASAVLLQMFLSSDNIAPTGAAAGLKLHILLSVTAYALLAIGAAQALILALQETRLRNHQPIRVMRVMPPLQALEELLVQALATGFFLLSLSLVTGLMLIHDLLEQRLSHKVVFSLLAWLIFATVLWGRWSRGWRGKTLSYWALGGFICLLIAYFGTKLVLELILKR